MPLAHVRNKGRLDVAQTPTRPQKSKESKRFKELQRDSKGFNESFQKSGASPSFSADSESLRSMHRDAGA